MKWTVVVGGWRTVGTYDTLEAAKEKAYTCVSSHVQIIETGEE